MAWNKYRNKKVEVDGLVFDSRKEAHRWNELKLLEKAGEITHLQRQVKFTLIPAQYEPTGEFFTKGDKKDQPKTRLVEKECAYYADFQYYDCNTNEFVIEDAKGMRTTEYIIKRKLMLEKYGIKISEV